MEIADFIGIPYRERGRTREGLDCFGVVVLFYKEILGIKLPDYTGYDGNWYRIGSDAVLTDKLNESAAVWRSVGTPEKYDILVFKFSSKVPNHCAIYMGNGMMLHAYENTPVVLDRFNSFWKSRLFNIMRIIEYECQS